jgi:hypothetical protein
MANKLTVSLHQFSTIPEGAVCRGSNAFEYDDIKRLDPPQTKEKLLDKDEKGVVVYVKPGYVEDKSEVLPPITKEIVKVSEEPIMIEIGVK